MDGSIAITFRLFLFIIPFCAIKLQSFFKDSSFPTSSLLISSSPFQSSNYHLFRFFSKNKAKGKIRSKRKGEKEINKKEEGKEESKGKGNEN